MIFYVLNTVSANPPLSPTGEFFVGDVQIQGREIVQVTPELPISDTDKVTDAENLTLCLE